MKKIQSLLLLFFFMNADAQTLDDSKQLLYYQKYNTAEQALHGYLQQHPSDAEAWFLLTKAYIMEDRPEAAIDTLAMAPADIMGEPYLLVARAASPLSRNRMDSSRILIEQAVDKTKGKNPDILAAAAEMQIMMGGDDMSYAIELLEKAIKRDKNNANLYVLLGRSYRKMHNGSEAFTAYRKAIEKDKRLAEPYYLLGSIFLSQKNDDLYVDYFNQAIAADQNYGPAYYQLYQYYVYNKPDPGKAMQFFKDYESHSERSIAHDYAETDLLYLNHNYQGAIEGATKLVESQGKKVQPRLYKLLAYSSAELKDTSDAIKYMNQYFVNEQDSNFIAKDFETMASLYASQQGGADSAISFFQRAVAISKDSVALFKYYKNLAADAAARKDYEAQSKWLGMYFNGNEAVSNVDIFNWGVAAYRSADYQMADSVFGIYTVKYPEQGFGYYWRARSNAALDTAMTEGLAIPYYQKLIEMKPVDSLESTEKKWVVEALGYLAAYETNTQKDYKAALDYFEQILAIDPQNSRVQDYIGILQNNMKKQEESN